LADILQSGTDRLIYDFMRGSGLREDPVIGFTAQGTVLQNSAARRFSAADLTAIQEAAAHADARGRAVAITSHGEVRLAVRTYTGSENRLVGITMPAPGRTATVTSIHRELAALAGRSAEWREAVKSVEQARTTSRPLILFGEAGTGKTSLAMNSAYGAGPVPAGTSVIDAGQFEVIGARRWFDRVRGSLHENMNVVLCNIEVLEKRQLTGLRAMLRASSQIHRVTMTVTATERSEAEPYALLFGAHAIEVPALRDRLEDLEALWAKFAARERPGAALGLDEGALIALGRYTWPGNLHELQTTVAHACSQRSHGNVTVAELPDRIRTSRSQGLMVQAEQDAIHRALIATGGNRTRAAEMLGISRATMYRKAKAFGIPA